MNDLSDQRFVTFESDAKRFTDIARSRLKNSGAKRIFDLGCGDGEIALSLCDAALSVTGIDISASSIALARARAAEIGVSDMARFEVGDYLQLEAPPSDVMISNSVLHLIDGDDNILAGKLARDLVQDGVLIATMPDARFLNQMIVNVRKSLRMIRGKWLDDLIFLIAKAVYPNVPAEVLKDRVGYMYLAPPRLHGDHWIAAMTAAGFKLVEIDEWPSTSFFKLRHVLTIWRRG